MDASLEQPTQLKSPHWQRLQKHSKNLKHFTFAIIIILIALSGWYYWWYTHHYISTDDAYVNANVLQIAAQINGKVTELNIVDNQYVKKGAVLFKIDPGPLANPQLDTYTTVIAPTDGWVAKLNLLVGDIVTENRPLFAFISDEEFWIDANFKETQLRHVQIGQEAVVENDVYPGKKFKGMVESISGAAGNAFSLLPPQNATGNWVKVVQRVPVRVRILNPDPNFPLRIGTSSTVTIRYDQPINSPQEGKAP